MKIKILRLLAICVVLLSNSCNKALKDVDDYFVKISTVSATVQTDGTLLVKGNIESIGNGPVEITGFCYNTQGNPEMLDNQIIATIDGNTFSVTYPCSNFSVDSAYYFRSWATNDYGYSYGNTIRVDSILAPSVTPPCSLTANTVRISSSTGTFTYTDVTVPSYYMGEWSFDGSSGGPSVSYTFGSALTTGIYTTTSNTSPGAGQVYVSFYQGAISGALNAGTSVYVNTIGSGIYEVTICNAPWVYSSSTFYFFTRMTVPY